jgi:uncharacterized membrane protein YbhN (UPF0104 family)
MKIPDKKFRLLRFVAAMVIMSVSVCFFYREFSANRDSVISSGITFSFTGFMAAVITVILSYLFMTLAWHHGFKSHPDTGRLTIFNTFAVVNVSQLARYLPGKIWSFAFQMVLLKRKGVPKGLVLYINIYGTISMTLISGIIWFSYTLAYKAFVPRLFSFCMIVLLGAVYILTAFFSSITTGILISEISRRFRKNIQLFDIPKSTVIKFQAYLILTCILFSVSGYAACYSIDWHPDTNMMVPISAITIVSDLAGFIVLAAPGGLGIREGAMFFLFNGIIPKGIALVIPLAIRSITLTADLILGLTALLLFNKSDIKR